MRKSMFLVVGLVLAIAATAVARTGEPAGVLDRNAAENAAPRPPVVYESSQDGKPPTTTTTAVEHEAESATSLTRATVETIESTTAPADVTAPSLQILHPTDGQVFEAKEVVFEGLTEPGAAVFAGEYQADVRDDGSWRIVLFLSPGTNVVTFRAKDRAGNVGEAVVKPILQVPEIEKHEEEEEQDTPDVGFSANQVYGECSESPPYDVFWGTGQPGTVIKVQSEYGAATTEVNQDGHWEVKVFFPESNVGQTFAVHVKDGFENVTTFEFTRTG